MGLYDIQGGSDKTGRATDQDVDLTIHIMCTFRRRSILIVLICTIGLHRKPLLLLHTGQLSRTVLSGPPCMYRGFINSE